MGPNEYSRDIVNKMHLPFHYTVIAKPNHVHNYVENLAVFECIFMITMGIRNFINNTVQSYLLLHTLLHFMNFPSRTHIKILSGIF